MILFRQVKNNGGKSKQASASLMAGMALLACSERILRRNMEPL